MGPVLLLNLPDDAGFRLKAALTGEALTFNDQFLLVVVVIELSGFAMLMLRPRPKMGHGRRAPPKLE